jgi:hypothetical protein
MDNQTYNILKKNLPNDIIDKSLEDIYTYLVTKYKVKLIYINEQLIIFNMIVYDEQQKIFYRYKNTNNNNVILKKCIFVINYDNNIKTETFIESQDHPILIPNDKFKEYLSFNIHVQTICNGNDVSLNLQNFINNNNKICIKNVYHGTSYPNIYNMPYNYHGNWFTFGLSDNEKYSNVQIPAESASYYIVDKTNVIYRYKLKKEIRVFKMLTDKFLNTIKLDKENEFVLQYLILYLIFFDFRAITNAGKKTFYIFDEYTIRKHDGEIQKYNYTEYKNIHNLNQTEPIFNTGWQTLNFPSNGDGDKPLASKMCSYYRKNQNSINGWIIGDILHLQLCDPENTLSLDAKFINICNISNMNIIKNFQNYYTSIYGKKFLDIMIPYVKQELQNFYFNNILVHENVKILINKLGITNINENKLNNINNNNDFICNLNKQKYINDDIDNSISVNDKINKIKMLFFMIKKCNFLDVFNQYNKIINDADVINDINIYENNLNDDLKYVFNCF